MNDVAVAFVVGWAFAFVMAFVGFKMVRDNNIRIPQVIAVVSLVVIGMGVGGVMYAILFRG
jgi:hypothetical protein